MKGKTYFLVDGVSIGKWLNRNEWICFEQRNITLRSQSNKFFSSLSVQFTMNRFVWWLSKHWKCYSQLVSWLNDPTCEFSISWSIICLHNIEWVCATFIHWNTVCWIYTHTKLHNNNILYYWKPQNIYKSRTERW